MKRASSDQGGGKAKFASLFANAASRRPDPDQEPYKSLGAGTGLILWTSLTQTQGPFGDCRNPNGNRELPIT